MSTQLQSSNEEVYMQGIYKLVFPNGKLYVGKSINIEMRWEYHKQNRNSNTPVIQAIKKYGWDNITKEIIEIIEDRESLNPREMYWISKLRTNERQYGYNVTLGGDGGDTFSNKSEEEKDRTRSKLRKPCSEDSKKLISLKLKERYLDREHPSKGRQPWNKGKKTSHTPWNKNTKGLSTHVVTQEVRKAISIKLKGRPKSEEHKQKLRESLTGNVISEETRKKMSEAKKGVIIEQLECPYCGKVGKGKTMYRWHFYNCKDKI